MVNKLQNMFLRPSWAGAAGVVRGSAPASGSIPAHQRSDVRAIRCRFIEVYLCFRKVSGVISCEEAPSLAGSILKHSGQVRRQ